MAVQLYLNGLGVAGTAILVDFQPGFLNQVDPYLVQTSVRLPE